MSQTQRRLVYLIFIYTCVEGLVVNITYPHPISYIYKDALIALVYLGLLTANRPPSGSLTRLAVPVALFAAITLFYSAMPTPSGPLAMAVAIKQRLFYVPLMYVGYHFMRDVNDLKAIMRVIAWSAIPVSLFAIYLYFEGPQGLTSLGATYSAVSMSTSGAAGINFWRVPGTFNSPGQFGTYCSTVATYCVAFLLLPGVKGRERIVTIAALVCLLPALLVSGSRAPLGIFLVCAGLITLQMRRLSRLGLLAAFIYFVVTGAITYFGAGIGDRAASLASGENLLRFRETFFGQMFVPQVMREPMGEGLAVATIGARHFSTQRIRLVESYLGILGTEMGVFGLLAFVWLEVAIATMLIRARSQIRAAPERSVFYSFFVQGMLTLVLTSNSTGLDAIPGNLYFWFFLGVAVKIADAERWRSYWRVTQAQPAPMPAAYGAALAP